jgi:hypothetical protein
VFTIMKYVITNSINEEFFGLVIIISRDGAKLSL